MGNFTAGAYAVQQAMFPGEDGDQQWKALQPARDAAVKRVGEPGWHYNFHEKGQGLTSGTIIIKSGAGNEYYVVSAERSKGGKFEPHAEENMIEKLNSILDNKYKNIPNNSKVIFYTNLSPCTQCMDSVIPTFVKRVLTYAKNAQVSFVFDCYYAAGEVDSSFENLYGSWKKARDAYMQFCISMVKQYPAHVYKEQQRYPVSFRLRENTKGGGGHHMSTVIQKKVQKVA